MKRVAVPLLFLCLAVPLVGCPRPAVQMYRAETVYLSDITGRGAVLNNAGQVVGALMVDDELTPAVWKDGLTTDLDPGDTPFGAATAISDRGAIAGHRSVGDLTLWTCSEAASVYTHPGPLEAMAVNNQLRMVGYIVDDSNFRPFLFADDTLTLLPILGGWGSANDINERGDAVGFCADAEGLVAVRWTDSGVEELPGLGGDFSEAFAINDWGVIVGSSAYPNPFGDSMLGRACVWKNGKAILLEPVPGMWHSSAGDINNRNQVVGTCALDEGLSRATLWQRGAKCDTWEAVDLTERWTDVPEGHFLEQALAINDKGQILARAMHEHGWYYVLLTPVR